MNIIEQLMVEHVALRLRFHLATQSATESIYEVEDFVRNCHAKIEDEIVFPKLRDIPEAKQNLSRLEADHRMIDTIGDQIKLRTAQGELEILRKRISLYMNTIESHNASEESLVFPYWKVSDSEEIEATRRARSVIESFGLDRYLSITGISSKLLERVH
jgi:hemerythrin superfamily protein